MTSKLTMLAESELIRLHEVSREASWPGLPIMVARAYLHDVEQKDTTLRIGIAPDSYGLEQLTRGRGKYKASFHALLTKRLDEISVEEADAVVNTIEAIIDFYDANPTPVDGMFDTWVMDVGAESVIEVEELDEGNRIVSLLKIDVDGMPKGPQLFMAGQSPSSLPASTGRGIAYNPAGTRVALSSVGSPFVGLYANSSDGIGAIQTAPSPAPTGNSLANAWHPTGLALAAISTADPWLFCWAVTAGGAFSTAYGTPDGAPNAAQAVLFTPNGLSLIVGAVAGAASLRAWPFNSVTGFATHHANPVDALPGNLHSIAIHTSGDVVYVTHAGGTLLTAYAYDDVTGWGAATPALASLGIGVQTPLAVNPAGTVLAVGGNATPFLAFVALDPTTGAMGAVTYPEGDSIPPGTVRSLSWSKGGHWLAIGHEESPYLTVRRYSTLLGLRFDASFTEKNDAIPGKVWALDWLPGDEDHADTRLAAGHETTPFMTSFGRNF